MESNRNMWGSVKSSHCAARVTLSMGVVVKWGGHCCGIDVAHCGRPGWHGW
jgi:hypothetical protein